ncbi:MAG: sulfite exporter TauE/SafE family protein [Asticcacaulis sp.]
MPDSYTTLSALFSGGLVGFTLGLIGGGGSILATPLLLYVVGLSNPHMAIGTGALAVSVNAYTNFLGHARKGNVVWPCALVFAALGTVGALLGSSLGKAVDGQMLLFLFGLIMIAVGVFMLRPVTAVPTGPLVVTRPICIRTAALALIAGLASGFFGIGGGFLIVPALMLATRMPMIKAVGTSLLAVGTFGLSTALNYSFSGLVDWPIAGLFIVGGLGGGLIGTRLSLKLGQSKRLLNTLFAMIIFIVAAYILFKSGMALRSTS